MNSAIDSVKTFIKIIHDTLIKQSPYVHDTVWVLQQNSGSTFDKIWPLAAGSAIATVFSVAVMVINHRHNKNEEKQAKQDQNLAQLLSDLHLFGPKIMLNKALTEEYLKILKNIRIDIYPSTNVTFPIALSLKPWTELDIEHQEAHRLSMGMVISSELINHFMSQHRIELVEIINPQPCNLHIKKENWIEHLENKLGDTKKFIEQALDDWCKLVAILHVCRDQKETPGTESFEAAIAAEEEKLKKSVQIKKQEPSEGGVQA